MNKITYRNLTFLNADLVDGKCSTQHAMIGESLAYDTLDFTVWCPNPRLDSGFMTKDGNALITKDNYTFVYLQEIPLTDFVAGDPLCYYFGDTLINKFYLSNVKRIGRELYQFSCVSAIGLLDNSMHTGGIYNGTAIGTVLAEIFAGIAYTVDPVVNSVKLYGWLPYAKKRDNLQQITIATGLAIRAKSDGSVNITALSSDNKGAFGANRSVVGGKVEANTPCTAVQVTEHAFQAGAEDIVLCDESILGEKFIQFKEPVHSLVITGGTIISSGANYAKVQGSGAVKLTGKKYIHTIKRITKGTVKGDSSDSVLTVGDATLVTSLNSNALAQKLYDVFSLPSKIKTDVLYGSERCGDVVSVINPYTAVMESACTRKMDITFGSFLKASAEFLVGYKPSGIITGYQNKIVLTANQTWTVPAGVTEIRAILIGGGDGGQAGANGANGAIGGKLPSMTGNSGTWWTEAYNGEGGNGGKAGIGGNAGKVLDTGALSVSAGNTFTASIGSGGTGGTTNGALGTTGGNTTFGAYTSANGAPTESGYVDLLSGSIYGIKGLQGYDGAKGRGKTNYTEDRAVLFDKSGFPVSTHYNGNFGQSWCQYVWRDKESNTKWIYAMGGSGGGASQAADGANGTNGSTETNDGWGFCDGGTGGNGANAGTSLNATIYGSGGYGGHGGGGGGGGGAILNPNGDEYDWDGQGGIGGTGGAGGDGKSGCVIIYF